jgi:hypothetical protein
LDQKTIAATPCGSKMAAQGTPENGFCHRTYPAQMRFMDHSEYNAGMSVRLLADMIFTG